MKVCFKCGVKQPAHNFYRHPMMLDGHLNKCKECTKKYVRANRLANLSYYREYDRKRGNRQTPENLKLYRSKFPNKVKANRMVAYYIQAKKLFREPCEKCGNDKTHAHHDDYLKPLNVRWLCAACHCAWHKENGSGKNAQ